ncbi:dioxygenase [uncultured Tateyamaria sp.]|uniref:dioxygenase n=1 Tax=uncultured Tateyamaria sp. TaxID=455651 RepID=UPI00260E2E9D|nr:dioxygenase [uncultured Tateyamaria sp.]
MSAPSETLPKAHFSEQTSVEVVTAQNKNATDPRLREVMDVIIKHLHEAVKEIEPTQEEWMKAIQFLTTTGHKSDDWRQEFILLSDVLGVSMLVDAINARRPAGYPKTRFLARFMLRDRQSIQWGQIFALMAKGSRWWCVGRSATSMARLCKV